MGVPIFLASYHEVMRSAASFESWLAALEKRHLADLTFPEVRRALQALSSLYVERRHRLQPGAALDTAGKRAAFALFYGPLHFLLVREVVRRKTGGSPPPSRIVDLGCGTGAAGAAWALAVGGRPRLTGIDRSRWAVSEARWTYRTLDLRGEARRGELPQARFPERDAGLVAAFTLNELDRDSREAMLDRLLLASRRGATVSVVEPVARTTTPWWGKWKDAFSRRGGTADTWRFPSDLPETLRRLDRAAGLDHRELTGRSLWLPPSGQNESTASRSSP
jgi:hypothetical protein